MTRDDVRGGTPTSSFPAAPTIVDRHNQVIGVKADPGVPGTSGCLEIEVANPLKEAFGARERVEVPLSWVSALSRDEIRLSWGVQDPLLQSCLRRDGPGGLPPTASELETGSHGEGGA